MAKSELEHYSRDYALSLIASAVALAGLLWEARAAGLAGHRVPNHQPFAGLAAFAHFRNPSVAWHGPVRPAEAVPQTSPTQLHHQR